MFHFPQIISIYSHNHSRPFNSYRLNLILSTILKIGMLVHQVCRKTNQNKDFPVHLEDIYLITFQGDMFTAFFKLNELESELATNVRL